jgi:hypothetical protein
MPRTDEKQVEQAVEQCLAAAREGDDEVAHIREDAAHKMALEAIREGRGDAKRLAEIALRPSMFEFARWYA